MITYHLIIAFHNYDLMIDYITLHYITLHYITLHYITLHYIQTLHDSGYQFTIVYNVLKYFCSLLTT